MSSPAAWRRARTVIRQHETRFSVNRREIFSPQVTGNNQGTKGRSGTLITRFLNDHARHFSYPAVTVTVTACPAELRAQQGPLDHPPRSPRGHSPFDRTCHAT